MRGHSKGGLASVPFFRRLAEYDEETFGESGRKKRLAALASKFKNYDVEDLKQQEEDKMMTVRDF